MEYDRECERATPSGSATASLAVSALGDLGVFHADEVALLVALPLAVAVNDGVGKFDGVCEPVVEMDGVSDDVEEAEPVSDVEGVSEPVVEIDGVCEPVVEMDGVSDEVGEADSGGALEGV